ncbi:MULTISPECIES: apolipoprotein N-acyltransferase [Streptomyces]|uniref:Apolipoprotein N-acyltransferase n=4 Tax=Streptomyces TaxID=1883 RepID=A0A8A1UNQ9_STRR1|nr:MULTISPECIES: apolipoprotein N-acyltransferase [Streptomyces]QDA08357.1 apolipoprotein N-acyltransferase [Streptomyces rimosus]QEV79636.1 apolipoprotein N-acyltransferase [Streptomyces rimosus]QGY66511.1 apolipoprotein N-acyltransferase [Streptomyces rimosus R6-500]QST79605.1 apolipoprotein N-acyltransferase [Streptomyces rimosus subsp. rimosus ATCC 10970]QTL90496.1 apolipoprotein N-acyltransferase [Streptomyces rimosus subsp. rimosus]
MQVSADGRWEAGPGRVREGRGRGLPSAARRAALTSPWGRGAAAVAAGALPALAFPAPALWWLAYVALVPWILLARSARTHRRAALDGWLGGAGFMLAVHHWLLPSLHVFILVLAALLGLLWAPWGLLVRALLHGSPSAARCAASLVLVPSGWLMVELVRSWEYLGGPWGLLGASQWQVPPALRLASLGGVWLLSLLLVSVNTALALLVAVPRARVPAVAGLLVCAVGGTAAWLWAPVPRPAGTVRVGLVQPGEIVGADPRIARGEELTRSLAGRGVQLVVWGESSVNRDLTRNPAMSARLAALSRDVGADLLVNVDGRHAGQPGIYKSSVLVGPRGATGHRYDKMRLVPFGEYIPLRSVLGWATHVGKAADQNRMRGTRQVLMPVGSAGGLRVGPLVCFESAFPDMSRQLARDGAQLLVAQSSTSTFQDSWAPAQHASLAALRAAETWRPMAHATLTGVSAVYGPRGEPVGGRLGTERGAAAVYDIPLAEGTSPYARFGDWALYGAMLALGAYAGVAGARALRARRSARVR